MSGPFGSSQWMYSSGGFYPYEIEQSLRFNDNDSAYLSKLWGSAGNKKTFTYSFWIKRANIGSRMDFISFQQDVPISFNSDTLRVFLFGSDRLITSAQFRDVSAWYHIVLTVDSTDATSGDRIKLYVNGNRQTNFSTESYPSLNADANIYTAGLNQYIGRLYGGSNYFDGYVADMYYLDGIAEDASSFGETKSGIWVPKEYTGSYGTNGFYLSFADSANIGDDLSGNGNDWTANNLVSTDVLLDSPTNNWAVFNRGEPQSNTYTFSEGNLKVVSPSTGFPYLLSTMYVASGKWYGEFLLNSSNGFELVGIETAPFYGNKLIGADADGWGYASWDGSFLNNGSLTAYGNSYTTNDIIGVALDLENGYLYFSKNGVWQNSGDPASGASGTGGIDISSIAGTAVSMGVGDNDNSGSSTFTANFGQDSSFAGATTAGGNTDARGLGDFKYSVPANYLSLNTANLPDPAIDPAQDDVPADYFNTVLYTGTGAVRSVTGVGFQPDWVWFKRRGAAENHWLTDAVRGSTKGLFSNLTDAEATRTDQLTSFDADGFSLGADAAGYTNISGQSYVAWNWLAGNGTSSNTDGSITSTVSVNQKAGFSVVSYTGNATAGATIGHGLGVTPSMIIAKNRTGSAQNWQVWQSSMGDNVMQLNLTNAQVASTSNLVFTVADIDASVFKVGTNPSVNGSATDHIAYCFAEVEGYSKFGSYTGNGSTDGPFVYCGFRPAFIMTKRTNTTGEWWISDTSRDPDNAASSFVWAQSSGAEVSSSSYDYDILSNGFKLRTTYGDRNGSGSTFIFMAFAEAPVKYSNAR